MVLSWKVLKRERLKILCKMMYTKLLLKEAKSDSDANNFSGETSCHEQKLSKKKNKKKTATVYNYHHFGAESNQRQIQYAKLHDIFFVLRVYSSTKEAKKKHRFMKG